MPLQRHLFTVILGSIFCISLTAQDTIYLTRSDQINRSFRPAHYRIVEFVQERNQYLIRDYYLDNQLHSVGYSDAPDINHFLGEVTTYSQNGTIISIKDYEDYTKGWHTFFSDGVPASKFWCVNGKKERKGYFLSRDGDVYAVARFKNDQPYAQNVPMAMSYAGSNEFNIIRYKRGERVEQRLYYEDKTLAMKARLENSFEITSAEYYLPSGKKLGECTFQKKIPFHGTCIEFFDNSFFTARPASIKYIATYDNGLVLSKSSYSKSGSQIGQCTYRFNGPYNGQVIENDVLYTYVDGINTGLNTQYTKDLSRVLSQYEVVQGKREGSFIAFDDNGNVVAQAQFRNDRPFSGTIIEKNRKAEYADGALHGREEHFRDSGQLFRYTTYEAGIKEGEAGYFYDTLIPPIIGVYRQGKPYSGQFSDGKTNPTISTYANGEIVREITYARDTHLPVKEVSAAEGRTVEYDTDGSVLIEGFSKDGKPWNGTFREGRNLITYLDGKRHGTALLNDGKNLSQVTYVQGALDGPMTMTRDGHIIAEGAYKAGQPWSGTFVIKNTTANYENGAMHGRSTTRLSGHTEDVPYVQGVKNGEAYFYVRAGKDTVTYTGIYREDAPYSGTFLVDNRIETYANGVKHGVERVFARGFNGDPIAEYMYDHGRLHGESALYLDGKTYSGKFVDDLPFEGYCTREPPGARMQEYKIHYYREGQQTDIYVYYLPGYQLTEFRNDKPYDGLLRKHGSLNYGEIYHEGVPTKSFLVYGRDTIYTTTIDHMKGVTYNSKGDVIATTRYAGNYENGITEYKSGETITFRNGFMQSGCYTAAPQELSMLMSPRTSMEICVDSIRATITSSSSLQRIKTVSTHAPPPEIPWPMILNSRPMQDVVLDGGSETQFYDIETNVLICTMRRDGYRRTGISIVQNKNVFRVERHEGDYDIFEGSWDDALTKIRAWQAEPKDRD